MTRVRPNALSLAVAAAISSSISVTDALADRRLQIKSIDIRGNEQVEFVQSEVIVKPTLGHDQQPLLKSFTTTYPDQTQIRGGYKVPSEGFTDVLSGISGGVSSVDLFTTDNNNAAQKYTKVLKVGDEGVFRFTHNLAEEKLVIEVREGMTHQDSITAVRAQSDDHPSLEPLTKIASPSHLAGVLKGAYERAGNLGEADHYVDLITIEVDEFEVNGRTFMRLIAAGDQPPELQRLGQTLFVNDEVLLAAATSAYTQVHILGEHLQQDILEDLLSYHQPVGYVVHAEDNTQVYSVPEGYLKLEVTEATADRIVFLGQKQNPADIAFVECLYNLCEQFDANDNDKIARVKKDKVKSYQYVIRSTQMALLEEFADNLATQQDAELDQDKLAILAYYESIQQLLTIASQDATDEFELTAGQIEVTTSIITPGWLLVQLEKTFSFKPVLRELLNSRHFFLNVQRGTDILNELLMRGFALVEDTNFVKKVIANMVRKDLELENTEAELQAKIKARYATIAAHLNIENFDSNADVDAQQESLLEEINTLNAQKQRLLQEVQTMYDQEFAEDSYTRVKTSALTTILGTELSEYSPPGTPDDNALEAMLYSKHFRLKALEGELEDIRTPGHPKAWPEVLEKLSAVEKALHRGDLDQDDDVYLRRQDISKGIQEYIRNARRLAQVVALDILEVVEKELHVKVSEEDDKTTRLNRVFIILNSDLLSDKILDKIENEISEISWAWGWFYGWFRGSTILHGNVPKPLSLLAHLHHYKLEAPDPNKQATEQQTDRLEASEKTLNIKFNKENDKAARLARIYTTLDGDDSYENTLDQIHQTLCKEDSTALDESSLKLTKIRAILNYKIDDSYLDMQIRKQQTSLLGAIENELSIYPDDNDAAKERGKAVTVKLAKELDVAFDQDDDLSDQKATLRTKIQELIEKVAALYDDEAARRAWNNEIAHQLNIRDYEEDATIDDQNRLIGKKLQKLDKEVFNAGQPDVNERIAAIENELDRQIARLGPRPRYVLDREVARARQAILKAESELKTANQKLNAISDKQVVAALDATEEAEGLKPDSTQTCEDRINALRNRQVQLGGHDGTGGKIQQLNREKAQLTAVIANRKVDIERMKEVLKTAEKAVENDGGPFQYTPKQVKLLSDMQNYMKHRSVNKQALEAAIGLTELALENGKARPSLVDFDFDNEFAPIRLRAMVGDGLTFVQASRIVKVFKSLMTNDAHLPLGQIKYMPMIALAELQLLVNGVRGELQTGAQEYDDAIRSMGKTAIHFVEYETEDLKGFPEYFASHSAAGNKIITLLSEGLISKVELESYMKAVRDDDGHQTIAEFEHFLGYKHGVNVPHFKADVRMLAEKDVEEFMQSAFTPVTVTASGPAGMKESVDGMKEYAAAVIANYVLDDIAFDNGRRTAAFLTNLQDALTPYANAVGLSESDLIKAIHNTLMQAHSAAVEHQLNDLWIKPSAFLVQAVTWYYTSYKPLLVTHGAWQAADLSLSNMAFLYLLDLTNRGDYLHRMLVPFQYWLELCGDDPDRTGQYVYHSGIEQISEVGGLTMPLGKAASAVILLRTGSMLFARQYNANPQMYRSISRLVPEIVKSMGSGQGVQVPLLHRVTPQKVKTLASATAGLVLGPVATVGAYAHGFISGFTYAQTFGFALASSLTFDFFMNDNKLLTQWLGGPLGRSLDKMNRWIGVGETQDEYLKRTTIVTPQRFSENDEEYSSRVKANSTMYGWTRHEHYLQFRERRDRTMKLFENGWEKYFRENVPKWSFSHAESIPYSYTLGALYKLQQGGDQKVHSHDKSNPSQSGFLSATMTQRQL
ncbi:hypothetical protein [Endozoicomonas sp. 8E]|uniref:hypothetical protein n=1 Tax=Endozoicomonas sp. 8E TaxID=3035692 RepID=UPI00293907BE|nr:hypothetical protein [Endozoicomonas sp. 8E]WOG29618.1 hypothetical protein P6910_08180 [Endozoicomonas sp. 8E]